MKKKSNLIIIALLVMILSAPVVYLILVFVDKILLSKLDFIIVEGTKDAWIGFAGSIIGGLVTMLALYFTIKHENDREEISQSKSVRPFIIATPEFKNDFASSIDEFSDDAFYAISLTVKNISNNLVKDLIIESEDIYEFNEKTKEYDLEIRNLIKENKTNYSIFTIILDTRSMIEPFSSFDFQTNFLINNYKTESKNSVHSFKIKMIYKYRDVLDIIEYTHCSEYKLLINYTVKGDFILFSQDVKNRIIKEEKIM